MWIGGWGGGVAVRCGAQRRTLRDAWCVSILTIHCTREALHVIKRQNVILSSPRNDLQFSASDSCVAGTCTEHCSFIDSRLGFRHPVRSHFLSCKRSPSADIYLSFSLALSPLSGRDWFSCPSPASHQSVSAVESAACHGAWTLLRDWEEGQRLAACFDSFRDS